MTPSKNRTDQEPVASGDGFARLARRTSAGRTAPQLGLFARPAEGAATGGIPANVHFSSKTNEWSTPQDFFDRCHAEFNFTLDPCSTHANAKCAKHYTLEDDGLARDWGHERVFMNPPYGREIGHWMRKAWLSAQAGALVVCLVPARTDTRWWHEYAIKGEIRFVRGRLKFSNAIYNAPFPVALVILGRDAGGRGASPSAPKAREAGEQRAERRPERQVMSEANKLTEGSVAGVRSSDWLPGPRSGAGIPGVSGGLREAQLAVARSRSVVLSVKPLFAWYDFWVGIFWDSRKRRIYILPLPCVGIVIELAEPQTGSETAAAASGPGNK